ncbi:hypothetical protein FC35_GL000595 [Limosilactobacillus coleohominis DSM 14060]|nr:hypothetical protein FC35_GL000595 [Limosilactobacillus coleohominis DSM 14060]
MKISIANQRIQTKTSPKIIFKIIFMSSNRHFVVISISRTVGLRNAPGLKEKVNN